MINQNGQRVSLVVTDILGAVANASSADVDFGVDGPCLILPTATGDIEVVDASGRSAIVGVTADVFFPAMMAGTKAAGSGAIPYSYWR